jgi:hypothetical protein
VDQWSAPFLPENTDIPYGIKKRLEVWPKDDRRALQNSTEACNIWAGEEYAVATRLKLIIVYYQAEEVRRRIGAVAYMETSSKTGEGCREAMITIIKKTLEAQLKVRNKRWCSMESLNFMWSVLFHTDYSIFGLLTLCITLYD